MVESNIRKLNRMELLYRCISKLVIYQNESGMDDRIFPMEHYYNPNDFNSFIYHSQSTDADDLIVILLRNADLLIARCRDHDDVTKYQLLVRCVPEQTIDDNGSHRARNREDGFLGSDIMQRTADPDATYREKASKSHRGYTSNIKESVGGNGSVVTDYRYDKNNVSDSALLNEHLNSMDGLG